MTGNLTSCANFVIEYIGQLEGEVAAKTNEANDYRARNEALLAENQRLSDLTRMLLSSSAFSTFLNDLTTTGMSTPSVSAPEQSPPTQATTVPSKTRKDPNPHQLAQLHALDRQQGGAQVGMALIPDNTLDFSTLDLNNNVFAGSINHGYTHAQVFSVTDVPQGPAVDRFDSSALSGKSSNFVGLSSSSDDCKYQVPVIERIPVATEGKEEDATRTLPDPTVDFDDSDPAFALFMDGSPPVDAASEEPQELLFGSFEAEKVFARLEIITDDESADGTVSAATMERFEGMCFRLEAAFQRVSNVTSHL